MSIEIRSKQCIGCGRCRSICPGSLICLQRGKAEILRPERCWGCASCLKECPVQAIALYLGEDIGGLGGRFTIRRTGTQLHWTLTNPDGSTKTLTVDSRSANKY